MELKAVKITEYEILSDDRRTAISIFLKGVVIALAFLGVMLKVYFDIPEDNTKGRLLIWGCGLVALFFFHGVIWRCRKYILSIDSHLNKIVEIVGFNPNISATFIFNIVWFFAVFVFLSWALLWFI
jgi:hypothetical protein